MANRDRGGMDIGVTSDLILRLWQHRKGHGSIHAREFGRKRLAYAEQHTEIAPAIAGEKLVEKWRREWKFALIEAGNPDWLDLWDQCYPVAAPQGDIAK